MPSSRFPGKVNSLNFLRSKGLSIGTVIDVGVQYQTRELITVFPDARHVLFEPIEEYYELIEKNYKGLDFELVDVAVSNTVGTATLSINRKDSKQITHSSISLGSAKSEKREVKMLSLDDFFAGKTYPKPYLLKIDVDGHELPILSGAKSTLKDVACVVIEAPLMKLYERFSYLLESGFVLWDIVDLCYYYGNLSQVDLIFLNQNEKNRDNFSPWQSFEFKWDEWNQFSETNVATPNGP